MEIEFWNRAARISARDNFKLLRSSICGSISVSWAASISKPRPRYKLPRSSDIPLAQFYWLAPPFWPRRLQIKAAHNLSLRKPTGVLYASILHFLDTRYTLQKLKYRVKRGLTVVCNWRKMRWQSPISDDIRTGPLMWQGHPQRTPDSKTAETGAGVVGERYPRCSDRKRSGKRTVDG